MTRRGSLAYYLAAWVCGCFFMTAGFWMDVRFVGHPLGLTEMKDVGFLALVFFGLLFGAIPSLIFGWVLRMFLGRIERGQVWLWLVGGAVCAFLLVWGLGSLAHLARERRFLPYSALPIWPFFLVGPAFIEEGSLWLTLPAGAATAAVLFAVHRAFAQPPEDAKERNRDSSG